MYVYIYIYMYICAVCVCVCVCVCVRVQWNTFNGWAVGAHGVGYAGAEPRTFRTEHVFSSYASPLSRPAGPYADVC
jgi:hypothetical protein